VYLSLDLIYEQESTYLILRKYDRKGIWGKKYEKVQRKEKEKKKKNGEKWRKMEKTGLYFP
jgi:hypothetical protein